MIPAPRKHSAIPLNARGDRLYSDPSGILYGVIHGSLPNKSNSRKIVRVRGRMLVIKSEEARAYEVRFREAAWRSLGKFEPLATDAKLYLKATVYQENMRRDLDCELLPDLLQKFNIIRNDRQFFRKEYTRRIDRENPRVEFECGIWMEE